MVDFVPKIKIEMVVPESMEKTVLDALVESARTGEVGDGKIFVTDLTQAIRIRTGESGREAL